eukprot:scaffold18755_cov99-Amphora_coffeaeformis.AAC.3
MDGTDFFHDNNGQKRYDKCWLSISKRLHADELVERKIHMESCRPLVVSKDEWEVKFHVHETLNSGIDGAGHGCFADKDFRKGAIVGLYMGGDVGDPKYSIMPGWSAAKDVTCFTFTNPMALEG